MVIGMCCSNELLDLVRSVHDSMYHRNDCDRERCEVDYHAARSFMVVWDDLDRHRAHPLIRVLSFCVPPVG